MGMVEVKTSELIGPMLDWAVAKAQGWQMVRVPTDIDGNFGGEVLAPPDFSNNFKFPNRGRVGPAFFLRRWSTDWSQGGPLIDSHKLTIVTGNSSGWCVVRSWSMGIVANTYPDGPTHLIAACRAIVAAKLGDTVSVPKELMQ